MSEQIRIPVAIMRGGTSKAVFLAQRDVPGDPDRRARLLLALFGSPDPRQIDGLGGADILTSKCAIIGPPSRPDADIDYTFAQIGIDEPTVSYEMVCGNISSATGVYALQEKLVAVREPVTEVRVHNTNTGRILRLLVQCVDGEPRVEGDCEIDGVPGRAAAVALDYSETSGGATGRLLPTGHSRDSVHVPLLGREIEVPLVDVGTVCVFIRAADLGETGCELPGEFNARTFEVAEIIRQWAAERCGLQGIYTPYQIIVGPRQNYRVLGGGRTVEAAEVDLVARMVGANGLVHKAFPGGGSVCLSIAAQIEGTVVSLVRGDHGGPTRIRIGHPSGVLGVYGHVARGADSEWSVQEVHFVRTARRLMDGFAYVRASVLGGADK